MAEAMSLIDRASGYIAAYSNTGPDAVWTRISSEEAPLVGENIHERWLGEELNKSKYIKTGERVEMPPALDDTENDRLKK